MEEIKEVMDKHAQELMSIPGVVGVYIGELDNGRLCIKIMVVEKSEIIEKEIPNTLEGHPVRIDVTGEIRPLKKKNTPH